MTVAFPVSSFSVILSITHHLFSFWTVGAVRRRLSAPTGLAPLHGSHVAVPIACDISNVQAVAVREYHYQTGQVMAIKEDKSFTGTQIGYRSLLLEKGHGVSVSTARCLSKVLNCFIQLSKNTKEENRLSYISRWKRAKA